MTNPIKLATFLQHFHRDSKMAGHSKVTETLQQEVVQMKAKGMTLSAIARESGHSKSAIS